MARNEVVLRVLKIIPGALSWSIIIIIACLAFLNPVAAAVVILTFDLLWIIRTLYLTSLLIIARRQLALHRDKDWLLDCRNAPQSCPWQKIYHLIIFPVYKESSEILRSSLLALKNSNYPMDKLIVILSFEERHGPAHETARVLENEFAKSFFRYITTFHPQNLPGEANTKGANATWAAKKAKEFIEGKAIPLENVLVSCFDADTCVEKEYLPCLTYNFLNNEKPHQASYQPFPVYNNNIWYASSFARLVEVTTSFNQMIESLRLEKFVTFSSHSMSFKTLVDIGYWPVDMISDDSVVYWKAYLFYKGDYRVIPLHVTVSMDAAYSDNFFKTIAVQYKQKRRWAWGVENFPYVLSRFLKEKEIPLPKKIRRSYHLLESHVTWAIWAVMITLLPTLVILFGGAAFSRMPIGYNFSRITGMLFNFALFSGVIIIFLSRTILPPRPADVKWSRNIVMLLEWVFVPLIIILLGSTPALDAQTRLMLGKEMVFYTTEKKRG
ncbi:MAG: glycosyltransferase family 2 protein [Candidatus Omnitrophota bacterium]